MSAARARAQAPAPAPVPASALPPGPATVPRAIQVQTAVESRADADRMATVLVERRLAACVQILGPISSTYRWEGGIEAADEWLVLIKSTPSAYPSLEAAIRTLHPYTEPEIIALPVLDGSAGYLDWIARSVSAPDAGASVES